MQNNKYWYTANMGFSLKEENLNPRFKDYSTCWRDTVSENDTVLMMGNMVADNCEYWADWLWNLPGHKVYVMGPQDYRFNRYDQSVLMSAFDTVIPRHKFYVIDTRNLTGNVPEGFLMCSYVAPRYPPKILKVLNKYHKKTHFFLKKVYNNPKNGFVAYLDLVRCMHNAYSYPIRLEEKLDQIWCGTAATKNSY